MLSPFADAALPAPSGSKPPARPPRRHPLHSLRRLSERLAERLAQEMSRGLPSDLAEDCRQEIRILFWKITPRLVHLPPDEQTAYLRSCARRALRRFLSPEYRRIAAVQSLEELACGDKPGWEPICPKPPPAQAAFSGSLREQIQEPELAAAVSALPALDYRVLALFYQEELSDQEIAQRLAASGSEKPSPTAVKMRRHRVLGRLRGGLKKADENTGENPRCCVTYK